MQKSHVYRTAGLRRMSTSAESLAVSLFHLTHLLQAGIGLGDALSTLKALESGYRRRLVWADVCRSVNAGQSLSSSMSLWPAFFPPVLLALLKAGEANAQLGQACQKSMELLQWQSGLKTRMLTALVYPLFSLLVMLGVVSFLFVAVVPSMNQFLSSTESPLAWHTQWLFAVSAWLSNYLVPSMAAALVLVLTALGASRLSRGLRVLSAGVCLRIPVLGGILTSLSLSRYASTSARLYASGVQLEQCLELSESLVRNPALRGQLRDVRQGLVCGKGLSRSMATATLVPVAFRKLVAAGEATGALEQALTRAGALEQQQAELVIGRAEALLGPVLLLVIGSNLLWIVISIVSPVYNAAIDAVVFS